jgi:protein RecA
MTKAGKIDISAMKKAINKKVGMDIAHDLRETNPSAVDEWIPTGSRWLDSIICRGKMAGIPVGRITELAGLSGSGKSYMAAQIGAQAQKLGHVVVYFDAENAIDPEFLEQCGIDVSENFIYIQAVSVEKTLEMIEFMMEENRGVQFLFIWDSIAATAAEKDLEGDFNPQSSMAVKPRIFSKMFQKLAIPIGNNKCTLLAINQLKTNISSNSWQMLAEPYFTPGGKALIYAYSLRIWLTKRRGKNAYIEQNGVRVGSEVKVRLPKSRFGTENRECTFKIMWGSEVGIQDEESWLEALRASGSDRFKPSAWNKMFDRNGKEFKFQRAHWMTKLQDPEFRACVLDIMDDEIINKFETTGTSFKVDEESDED